MNLPTTSAPASIPAPPSPLLERLRLAAIQRGDSTATADTLVSWSRAFILFHNKRHPAELGLPEVTHFLEHVVKTSVDPLVSLAQARAALMLLYRHVLGRDLGELPQPRPPRVLDQLRHVLRVRHYSPRTEDCYAHWAQHFILFHHKRQPRTLVTVRTMRSHARVTTTIAAATIARPRNAPSATAAPMARTTTTATRPSRVRPRTRAAPVTCRRTKLVEVETACPTAVAASFTFPTTVVVA